MASSVVDLDIESIAAGGDGVARSEGMVVFVPRTAPGDRIRARVEARGRFARGKVESILVPSARRVEPACAHYRIDRCGGCQIQHLAYDAQLDAKAGIVRDSLLRIGRRDVEPPTVNASDRQWRYRIKLTLAMRRRAGGWVIGLHPYDDPVGVFQLEDCPITDERVVAIWRSVMAASPCFPQADELRASVRLVEGGAAIVMEGGTRWNRRSDFFAAVPDAVALWWKPAGGARRLVAERAAARAGGSFAQVNAGVAAALRAHVVERAALHQPDVVIDAYAGSGDTAVALAAHGARVTAIELDREAAAHCAERLPSGSRAITGRVEDALPTALPSDVVVINPPRTGVHERVAATLDGAAHALRAVLYVSCNPATLARDLARMPAFRIASLVSFDMFPQTAHVETVCELVPLMETA